MCGMFIYWAHQQVLLSSIASPYLIPKLSSTISSAKEEASSFRVRCPQPWRLPVCGTQTGEPDWKLQEGRDSASTGTVSLGPERDKQAPLPGHGREEKTGPGHGCVVAKFTQPATGTSTVPITLASLPPGLAHLHDLEAPFAAVFTHRTGAPKEPDPELGQGSAQAHVRVSPAPSRAGSGAGSSEGSRGLAFVPGTGAKGKSLLNSCLQCRVSALAWAMANPQQHIPVSYQPAVN